MFCSWDGVVVVVMMSLWGGAVCLWGDMVDLWGIVVCLWDDRVGLWVDVVWQRNYQPLLSGWRASGCGLVGVCESE